MLGKLTALLALVLLAFPTVAPSLPASGIFLAATGASDVLDLAAFPQATVSSGAEPSILVDRLTGAILIGDTGGIHRSVNGGATWTHPAEPFLPGLFTDGRAFAQDSAGKLYAATTQGQTIGVATSTNGGATWTIASHLAAVAHIADRPWLAAGGPDVVALMYFGAAQEMCALSTDGGLTWTKVSALESPNAGNAVIDARGRLWYAEDSAVTYYPTPCALSPPNIPLPPSGAQIFTQVAIDPTQLLPDQFVAQPSPDNGQMLLRGHKTLSPTLHPWKDVVVSAPNVRSNTFGAIAIKPDASELAVAWYGSATGGDPSSETYPPNAVWNVYVSRVTGFWGVSPTVTTTLVASGNHVGQFCMSGVACTTQDRDLLDYMGVTYGADEKLHVAYGHDGSTSTSSVLHVNLG